MRRAAGRNWCLARVLANWAQRAAEQTYGLTGDQLTPWIDTSAYSLRKAWNAAKPQVLAVTPFVATSRASVLVKAMIPPFAPE